MRSLAYLHLKSKVDEKHAKMKNRKKLKTYNTILTRNSFLKNIFITIRHFKIFVRISIMILPFKSKLKQLVRMNMEGMIINED